MGEKYLSFQNEFKIKSAGINLPIISMENQFMRYLPRGFKVNDHHVQYIYWYIDFIEKDDLRF